MTMANALSFPVRTIPELLEELKGEFPSLVFSEDDFQRPSRERWEKFFTVIVSSVFDITTDVHRQSPFNLKYPDLHSQSIYLFNLTSAMRRMLRGMGWEETGDTPFCIGDINHPVPRRLIKVCSAIVNFVPFAQRRYESCDEIRREKQAEIEQSLEYQQRIDERQQKINAHKKEKAQCQEEINKLTAAVQEEQSHCDKLSLTAAMVRKQMEESKLADAGIRAQIASLNEKVVHTKGENSRLSDMIVPSPGRIKSEMDRMKQQLQNLVLRHEEKLLRLEELSTKKNMMMEKWEECDPALKVMNSIKENIDSEKQTQRELSDIQQKAAACREQLKNTQQQLMEIQRKKLTKTDKTDKMELQFGQQLTDKKVAVDQIKLEIEHLQLTASDGVAKACALGEEVKVHEEEEKKFVEIYQQQIRQLQSQYKELTQALDAYHVQLSAEARLVLD